jgi:hypothetical protein
VSVDPQRTPGPAGNASGTDMTSAEHDAARARRDEDARYSAIVGAIARHYAGRVPELTARLAPVLAGGATLDWPAAARVALLRKATLA